MAVTAVRSFFHLGFYFYFSAPDISYYILDTITEANKKQTETKHFQIIDTKLVSIG